MTLHSDAGPGLAHGAFPLRATPALSHWLMLAAIFAMAVALRHFVAGNTDVSWLLIVGERVLDGQRLYVDVIETNPPMAVLVYIPGILLARALGLPAEIVTDALLFIGIAGSLAVTARVLRSSSALEDVQRWPFAFLAVGVLTIMPTQAFAQREHIAVVELLPALAILAMRLKRERPPLWAIVIAGIGLGLALSFKPHFVIAVFCAFCILAFYLKSWRIFAAPENFIAAAVVGAYGVCTLIFFPEYFTVMGPLARDIYIPFSLPAVAMLHNPIVAPWAIAMIAAVLRIRRRGFDTSFLLLLSMSFGFAIIFFLQRKGWPYHSYPMMAFALLALGYAIGPVGGRAGHDRAISAGVVILLAALFVKSMVWFDHAFDARALQAAVARFGPDPKILAITGQAGLGHPLTRALGGTWVSRQQGLWIADYYSYLRKQGTPDPLTTAAMDGYAALEREWLVADVRKIQPTVVLVDNFTGDWSRWVQANPDVADLLKGYRVAETFMGIDILIKRAD